jgi:Protein of Unknown function (DUF2784)
MSAKEYKTFADILVSIHFLWSLFLLGGIIVTILFPAYAIVQIIVMSFTLLIALPFHNTCPLTLLEEKWRRKADPSYRASGSFVARYLNKVLKANLNHHAVDETLAGMYVLAYAIAISIMILRGYGFLGG